MTYGRDIKNSLENLQSIAELALTAKENISGMVYACMDLNQKFLRESECSNILEAMEVLQTIASRAEIAIGEYHESKKEKPIGGGTKKESESGSITELSR